MFICNLHTLNLKFLFCITYITHVDMAKIGDFYENGQ